MLGSIRKLLSCCDRRKKGAEGKDESIEITRVTTVNSQPAGGDTNTQSRPAEGEASASSAPQLQSAASGEQHMSNPRQQRNGSLPAPKPQSLTPSSKPDSDPDEILPVQSQQKSQIANVKDALEDRRKLFERLRRPDGAEPSAVPSTSSPVTRVSELPAQGGDERAGAG